MKATIQTPMSKDDPQEVAVEEIDLPPPELWGALDNGGPSQPAQAVEQRPAKKREFETLAFKTGQWRKVIPLEFAFDHPTLGEVTEITVRRLNVGEIGQFLDERDVDAPDNFDIYSVMCGLPETVLRGLMDVDGERVSEACYDFLPRVYRPIRADGSSSTSQAGET